MPGARNPSAWAELFEPEHVRNPTLCSPLPTWSCPEYGHNKAIRTGAGPGRGVPSAATSMRRRHSGRARVHRCPRDDTNLHRDARAGEEPQGGGLDRMRVRMGSTRDCAAENLTRVSFFENTVCDRSVELRDMPPTERRNEWLLLPRKG